MITRTLIAAAAALTLCAGPALAEHGRRGGGPPDLSETFSPHEARDAVEQGRHVQLQSILREIEGRWPGRIIGQDLVRGEPSVYVILWLTDDGRRLTIRANAETGAILGVSGG